MSKPAMRTAQFHTEEDALIFIHHSTQAGWTCSRPLEHPDGRWLVKTNRPYSPPKKPEFDNNRVFAAVGIVVLLAVLGTMVFFIYRKHREFYGTPEESKITVIVR
jgi:hypothetical protein